MIIGKKKESDSFWTLLALRIVLRISCRRNLISPLVAYQSRAIKVDQTKRSTKVLRKKHQEPENAGEILDADKAA